MRYLVEIQAVRGHARKGNTVDVDRTVAFLVHDRGKLGREQTGSAIRQGTFTPFLAADLKSIAHAVCLHEVPAQNVNDLRVNFRQELEQIKDLDWYVFKTQMTQQSGVGKGADSIVRQCTTTDENAVR